MFVISLNAIEVGYLEAIKAKRRPHSMEAWNRSVDTLKHLTALGLISFHDNLVFFRNAFDLTSLGRDTLKMHRDGDFDSVSKDGQSWMRFYY